MIPLRDLNPTRRTPFCTYALIALNVLVFLWEQSFSQAQLQTIFTTLSVVPANVSQAPFSPETILDMIRSMFFHGGWAHILGNMLYLYLFGDNVEDRFGAVLYLVIYFASGFGAAYAQVIMDPTSTTPLVGASGAISGVLGGYLVLYPRVEVRGIIPIGYFFYQVRWPAVAVLGLWFVMQLFYAIFSIGGQADGGVAFFAHVGGFVVGIVLVYLLMQIYRQPPVREREDMLYDRARRYRY